MRLLPCGSSALLVELADLDEVLGYYAALRAAPPAGVVDIVPAARTVMVAIDPAVTGLAALERSLRDTVAREDRRAGGDLVEIPVVYDGQDLADVAELLGCDVAEVVRRHTSDEWTVAFCGFAPGFGYLTGQSEWNVPRRSSPRTKVPAGSVALAGEFSGVYPRESPGGWQLLGRTEVAVFDLDRDPAALLSPGRRVRFVDVRDTSRGAR
ncbi:Allophanate hydrolase subunit 1 [Kribbella flavida DSM 17836]|uniref:Allophanate hydrolase subunit 1 n=1 Tax=Kribbella flavida (strain DSM 17836 / JCM 10339 / NBRC 14399) TaxID=479435 RepID=D2PYH9_KRIFD|nr:allophanate hydrolase subunit 1 [Kribbella flavida]ADB35547.1 Allophanate hydrolase subunit 1 [Kribbella flavida DSM 17836]